MRCKGCENMKLIVGLGNPGMEYEHTRHNMGFDTIDCLMENHIGGELTSKGYQGLYCKINYKGEPIIFLKPQTYMNLSGQSVLEISQFYKINVDDILIIYDDMDLEPGKIRIRKNGSAGGHNGMKNIISLLGTQEIKRIRIGIGKPEHDVIDYVLGKPSSTDQENIDKAIIKASKAIIDYLDNGFDHMMNHYN
jgi:PTH1 family peptidyl-tRNA hydrolase